MTDTTAMLEALNELDEMVATLNPDCCNSSFPIAAARRHLATLRQSALAGQADAVPTDALRIVEEVPGVEPHWFVAGLIKAGDSPKFDKHSSAVAFCEALGRTYTTEYFTP